MSPETPQYVQKLFWEYSISSIDMLFHKQFVIERVLEKGTFKAVKWLFTTYSLEDIKQSLSSLNISPTTRGFWNTYFATIA